MVAKKRGLRAEVYHGARVRASPRVRRAPLLARAKKFLLWTGAVFDTIPTLRSHQLRRMVRTPAPETPSMTHEEARRPVSRLWLRAFAGIVAVLSAAPSTAGVLPLEPIGPESPYAAVSTAGTALRKPVSAFETEHGVYELDLVASSIRVWPRGTMDGELVGSRFHGIDASGNGKAFENPKRMTKKAGGNLIAVVDADVTNENLGKMPGVSFYEFAETVGTDGVLSSVTFTFKGRFEHDLFRYAEDVAFFPDGADFSVAVAVTYENNYAMAGETRQSWIALGSGGFDSVELAGAVFAVRDKAAYTNTEPVVSWPTTLAVGSDSSIWAGSRSMGSVLRYDAEGVDYTTEVVHWTWVYELEGGPTGYAGGSGHYEPEIDPNPCAVADFVVGELDESGSENNRIGAPGGIRIWGDSPVGELLLVADTDNNRIVAFDAAGNECFRVGSKGSLPGEFTNPQDVWVNDDGTELVVADFGNGRVQIFSLEGVAAAVESYDLSGFTTFSWEDKDHTVARTNAVFYSESDSVPVTNWLVAASASRTNRTYSVSVESDPAGAVALVTETVDLPAGATRAPIVFYALDGSAAGTPCTISVGGVERSFTISNVPPSFATGSGGSWTDPAYAHSFAYSDEAAATVANADFEIRQVGSEIHFHAKAADVAADDSVDAPLSYEWRIVGTKAAALVLARTYYTNVVETGIPPTRTFVRIPEDEALSFPAGENGGRLYIVTNEMLNVKTNYSPIIGSNLFDVQLVTNSWELVVTTNELFESVVATTNRYPSTWAGLFFDGTDYDSYLDADVTLTGPDVEFSTMEQDCLYFAMLTVSDKDGSSVRSIDTANRVYWCFQPTGDSPLPDGATYLARFTDVSGTNVAFVVFVESGDPSPSDQLFLRYAASLEGPWKDLFALKPGIMLINHANVSGQRVSFPTPNRTAREWLVETDGTLDVLFVYDDEPDDDVRFYRIFQ